MFWLIVFMLIGSINANTNVLRLRNTSLRFIISDDFQRLSRNINNMKLLTKEKINFIVNKCMSKYYHISYLYYELSDEEKDIIEFITSLCY